MNPESIKRSPGKLAHDILTMVPIFAKLNSEELRLIDGIVTTKRFPKERMIFLEGDTFTGFYIVLEGTIKVYKLSSDGSETVLHILKPYKSFAETSLFTKSKTYPACAQAIEDSTLLYVPKAEFTALMEESASLAIKISEAFATRLMELNKKFSQLSVNVEEKLARYLLDEITLNGTIRSPEPVCVLSTSKKNLAGQFGIAVETLSRNLRKLKDEGIIRETSRRIFVLDLRRLRELAG